MMGPNCMRILVLHAWLKGNLGDVLQLSVLLSALRELNPRVLDLAGYPAQPAAETAEVIRLVDNYLPDTFPWYWALAPHLLGKILFEPWWTRQRKALFSRYDAIICAPGPYLAAYDHRATSALSDIGVAAGLGLPVALSSHSVGPLPAPALATVARATIRIAREPSSFEYLRQHGVPAVLSADLAFLYPYPARAEDHGTIRPPYRLVFLRGNNLNADALRLEGGALLEDGRVIAEASGEPIVLATSDYRRDERFLTKAARRLGVASVRCHSVAHMASLIRASSGVVSDRYHPAICAAALGRPAQILSNREPHKTEGLRNLLADNTLEELQALARVGLRTLRNALAA